MIRIGTVASVVALAAFTLPIVAEGAAGAKPETAGALTPRTELESLKEDVSSLRADVDKLKSQAAPAQAEEKRKRDAEIAKLEAETRGIQRWFVPLLGVLIGFVSVAVTGWFGFKTALKARIGQFDMKLYEERIKAYGNMVSATRAFAMHFPERIVDREACAYAGRLLRAQFFSLTGTLLTVSARKRYMTLLHALTRAAHAGRLNVPRDDDDYATWISDAQVEEYRRILGLTVKPISAEHEMKRCAEHKFGKEVDPPALRGILASGPSPGEPGPAEEAAAELFQDYVVLQFASSRLRTELSNDVSSRRPLTEV